MGNPLFAPLYDRIMAAAEERGLRARRERLLGDARGAVLEIGAGTGLNVDAYPAAVERLVLTEPAPAMARRLRARVAASGRSGIEIVEAPADALPFDDATFDEAVTTLVLCSVADRVAALVEVRRVLRPGGRLRFLEHVAATPSGPSRLQRVLQPVQRTLADGCRLDLRMDPLLTAAGFTVERSEPFELPAPSWVRPAVAGVAVRASGG